MADVDLWESLRATEIPLYEGTAPGSEGWTQVEGEGTAHGLRVVRNVTRPTLTPFLLGGTASTPSSFPTEAQEQAVSRRSVPASSDPAHGVPANGVPATGVPAVIIAPGGAWHFLAWQHEGIDVARWLNARGIAAFILKYRLVATDDTFPADMVGRDVLAVSRSLMPLISADATEAIRLVRRRAGEWGIDPSKIGIMGFSAGGTVTSLASLQYDAGGDGRPSSRPDFAAPIYGAGAPGDVRPDAPPLFLAVAADDGLAPHTLEMFHRWRDAGKEAELHVYARGGHGFGMNATGLPSEGWIERFHEWLGMITGA